MNALLLAVALQGMTDAAYNSARARENPTVEQAQAVVTEAIQREAWEDSVIVTVNAAKRSECLIESATRKTCVRSTLLSLAHVHFDPPSVNEAETLDVAAIVAAERAWVGLPPLPTIPPTP